MSIGIYSSSAYSQAVGRAASDSAAAMGLREFWRSPFLAGQLQVCTPLYLRASQSSSERGARGVLNRRSRSSSTPITLGIGRFPPYAGGLPNQQRTHWRGERAGGASAGKVARAGRAGLHMCGQHASLRGRCPGRASPCAHHHRHGRVPPEAGHRLRPRRGVPAPGICPPGTHFMRPTCLRFSRLFTET